MLVGQRVCKTSGRPGKTQLINHFKINDQWFLVDLPGYGYAQVLRKKSYFSAFYRTVLLREGAIGLYFCLGRF